MTILIFRNHILKDIMVIFKFRPKPFSVLVLWKKIVKMTVTSLSIEFFLPEMGDRRKTIETDIIAPRLLCVTFKFWLFVSVHSIT